ncbi:MAG: hypothetical protein ACKVVT_02940 [Dehalococcoidia bacterium]
MPTVVVELDEPLFAGLVERAQREQRTVEALLAQLVAGFVQPSDGSDVRTIAEAQIARYRDVFDRLAEGGCVLARDTVSSSTA